LRDIPLFNDSKVWTYETIIEDEAEDPKIIPLGTPKTLA